MVNASITLSHKMNGYYFISYRFSFDGRFFLVFRLRCFRFLPFVLHSGGNNNNNTFNTYFGFYLFNMHKVPSSVRRYRNQIKKSKKVRSMRVKCGMRTCIVCKSDRLFILFRSLEWNIPFNFRFVSFFIWLNAFLCPAFLFLSNFIHIFFPLPKLI